jgi:hypothetical protein
VERQRHVKTDHLPVQRLKIIAEIQRRFGHFSNAVTAQKNPSPVNWSTRICLFQGDGFDAPMQHGTQLG